MRFLTLVILLPVTGCSAFNPMNWIAPHHMEIQQGNTVTQDMVAKLKPGMTRKQVRFLLGSPLITDLFHADRWDYKYQLYQNGKEVKNLLLTVYFNKDVLERVEGDTLAAERPLPSTDASEPVSTVKS